MKCPSCGKIISDNAVMCPHCNSFLDEKPAGPGQRPASGNYAAHSTSVKTKPVSSKKKKSAALLVSAILGILYAVYSIFYWGGASSGSSSAAYAIGAGIATAIVMPHLICAVLAAIFNTLGWAMNHRAFALTGAILYAVAMVFFPMYVMVVIIEMIRSFVGLAPF